MLLKFSFKVIKMHLLPIIVMIIIIILIFNIHSQDLYKNLCTILMRKHMMVFQNQEKLNLVVEMVFPSVEVQKDKIIKQIKEMIKLWMI